MVARKDLCFPKNLSFLLFSLLLSLFLLFLINYVLLMHSRHCTYRNATITLCHSYTKNLPDIVRQADVLIAAVGKAEMVCYTHARTPHICTCIKTNT